MNNLKFAPETKDTVISGDDLAKKLQVLIGTSFALTDKPRTNGSTLRKIISKIIDDSSVRIADKEQYSVIPYKGKGVPHLLACLCDSYIVTTGDAYNLQVWNRLPNSNNTLIRYSNGNAPIKCKDIRFIVSIRQNTRCSSCSLVVPLPPQ